MTYTLDIDLSLTQIMLSIDNNMMFVSKVHFKPIHNRKPFKQNVIDRV